MLGGVAVFINKKDREIYLLKEYITKIGYGQSMGYLIHTDRESLKSSILTCIKDSLSAYQKEIKDVAPPLKALRTKHGISFLNITIIYLFIIIQKIKLIR